MIGQIQLPYPIFSSKTVQGKPLHTWTLEGRLDEIKIPTNCSTVYTLELVGIDMLDRHTVVEQALNKINSVPPVTDERKAIGNDFRRADVRRDWQQVLEQDSLPRTYPIAHFSCVASSGTYMRTLASEIARAIGTGGLAWSIHRTAIGHFDHKRNQWSQQFH
jgi:tRNA U55 pseudouridine synthase TruB